MSHYKALAAMLVLTCGCAQTPKNTFTVAGLDKRVAFKLLVDQPRLRYSVRAGDATVVEDSPLVFTIDKEDVTDGARCVGTDDYKAMQTYATRGAHSKATDRHHAVTFEMEHGKTRYTLEVRAFDDGVAYRFVAKSDSRTARVPDEVSVFTLPAGATVWSHDLSGHYEGTYVKRDVGELRAGEWCAPPVTFKLPGSDGYGSITEAGLQNYSGMALEADGKRGLVVGLAHRQPVGHPFELRYKKEDIERLSHPAAIAGTITTPWRVVMIGQDLNALVNSDIVMNLSPPPDTKYFPHGVNTDWVKPGRATWQYLDRTYGSTAPPATRGSEERRSPQEMMDFTRWAGELGFEYNVIEGFWSRFTDDELRKLAQFGLERGVKQLVWVSSQSQRDPERRRALYKRLHDLGIGGLKVEFFDHEHKEMIDLYHDILRDAAEQKLLLIFHGANKPAGEQRTWPNEMNREAVKGMESSRMWHRAEHETTLPFTRWLAGPADYTPVHLGDRRADTTWAHQIASGAILSAPILTYAANPQHLLSNPAVEMIK